MRTLSALVTIPLLALGTAAWADAADDAAAKLAKSKSCLSCHTVDKKLVGPAYKDVAAKYAGRKDAQAYVVGKIKSGSAGVWGPVAMPPNDHVSDADAQTLAKWVLSRR